jgi:ketosteroid isomerase-like protein
MIKSVFILGMLSMVAPTLLWAQETVSKNKQNEEIFSLIDDYSLARENRDTVLLKKILTPDVDQLVSTGEWRNGIQSSVRGMLQSSAGTPGTRTLTIDKIKFLGTKNAIVDARYNIKNSDGTDRKMWSTFIVVKKKEAWKISAIRNMLPSVAR